MEEQLIHKWKRYHMFEFKKVLSVAILISSFAGNQHSFADGAPNDLPLDTSLNEHIIKIQDTDLFKSDIQTTIFKPTGEGPFPLVIFNHGHAEGSQKFGRLQQRERAIMFTREMLKKGYVVAIPMRKGYAGSGGGKTRDFTQQFEDVVTVTRYMQKENYIDNTNIVIAGHSVGGYVSMIMASKKDLTPNVKAVINFSGGLPITYNRKFEDELKSISNSTNAPALWIYGDNDYLTSPEKLNKLEAAYKVNNPKFKVIRTGEFKSSDAHFLLYNPDGLLHWKSELEQFLFENNLPSKEIRSYEFRTTTRTNINVLSPDASEKALEVLKNKSNNQWNGYQKFRSLTMNPKSFAISTENDRWGYSYGHDLTGDIAIKTCETKGIKCKLFALNDSIVEDQSTK